MSQSAAEELRSRLREVQGRLRKVESDIKVLSSGLTGSDMAAVQAIQPHSDEIKLLEGNRQRIIAERRRVEHQIQGLEDRLRLLKFWLTIESVGGISIAAIAGGSVYLFAVFLNGVPFIFWYSLLILAAVAFLPLLVSTLTRVRQYQWIWILIAMVALPASLNLIPINDKFFTLAFQLFPLLMFYAYCGLLRWVVEGWLD